MIDNFLIRKVRRAEMLFCVFTDTVPYGGQKVENQG